MDKKKLPSYLKTILWTMLTALVLIFVTLGVIQNQVYSEKDAEQLQNETIDYYLIGVLIEKNKYLEEKHPNDYRINLKLGILYNISKDYDNSEKQFKLSMLKAPYEEYRPIYRLALLYVQLNRLEEAQALMDEIGEKPNKMLITYKGNIYNKIGNKLYDMGDYEGSIPKYKKAISYYKIVKSNQIESVNNSLVSAYIYLAEQQLEKMQIEEAIESLQIAKSIVNAPIIRYKLALLLMNDNPELAYKYFEEVFKEEPNIINYEVYYKFLYLLATEAELKGNNALSNLYQHKIKVLKEYYQGNILSVDDITIENTKGQIKLNKWKGKYNINLGFKFKNASHSKINSLYLQIVFKDKDRVLDEYLKQVVDKKSSIMPGGYSPNINIKMTTKKLDTDKFPKEVYAEIYAYKTEDSNKLLLQTVNIRELHK